MGNDNEKRLDWPIGRVKEVIPGNDGHVRLVRVTTTRGQLLRPIQRIYPLEDNPGSIEEEEVFADFGSVNTKSRAPAEKLEDINKPVDSESTVSVADFGSVTVKSRVSTRCECHAQWSKN